MEVTKNVYLDTETTSTTPGQICELTLIVEDYSTHNLVDAKNYFFTVNQMDEGAQNVHGFSIPQLAELSGGETFKDRFEEIQKYLENSVIVAHNEAFDEKFLSAEFWRCGVSFAPAGRFCTMNSFKDIIQLPNRYPRYGKYKNPKLSEVLNFLNINEDKVKDYSCKILNYDGSKFHDSRFDTTAMYVAVNVYREKINGGNVWQQMFCN